MLRITNNKIEEELKKQQIGATEVASKIKVSYRTMYNIIKNKNTPSLSLAQSIAMLFKKPIDELFEFEEE
jgi:putative transcriptional regulator